MLYNAGITGIGAHVPEKVLTNQDLEKIVETSDEWITTRTGIKERRIAAENETASDLSYEASKKALKMAGIEASELDLIIVCTVTPDMMFPSTSCIIQQKLNAVKAAAFDMSAGCTGFVYGLTTATQFIQTGFYKNILLVGCDLLSKITDFTDRNTCVLFGDGAGAVVVSRTDKNGIIQNYIAADGTGSEYLTLPGGNSKQPATHETVDQRLHYIKMEGKEVFKFAVNALPRAINEVLSKASMSIADIDILLPHQANIRIIDAAVRKLDITNDKVFTTIEKYGNMSAASIPVTLASIVEEGKIKKGDKLVMVGFGAGLTYGSSLIEWLI